MTPSSSDRGADRFLEGGAFHCGSAERSAVLRREAAI